MTVRVPSSVAGVPDKIRVLFEQGQADFSAFLVAFFSATYFDQILPKSALILTTGHRNFYRDVGGIEKLPSSRDLLRFSTM